MKGKDWKIMENITGEIFPPENANFTIFSRRNVIGQGILQCSEVLRESGGKQPDWGMRQILHPLYYFT